MCAQVCVHITTSCEKSPLGGPLRLFFTLQVNYILSTQAIPLSRWSFRRLLHPLLCCFAVEAVTAEQEMERLRAPLIASQEGEEEPVVNTR